LLDYRAFNHRIGEDVAWLDDWLARHGHHDVADHTDLAGGTFLRTRAEIQEAVRGVGEAFFETRHSIRNFDTGDVPISDIQRAVGMARKAPSVCNRQGARVHCFQEASVALKWQPGNTGFGHLASRALVVTADLMAFSSVGERHQVYVDGGLFAMSLVYALHALGHGTCMLAWSQERDRNRQAKADLSIPDSETIIMMIAVGRLPETLSVARSWRRPVSDILRVV